MTNNINHEKYIKVAKDVLDNEIIGLNSIKNNSLNENFINVVEKILNTKGRIIISGIGKSGHIARKLVATLSSTGTPSIFVHPGEASHGDIGMVQKGDTVICISDSGGTPELRDLIFYCKKFEIPIIGITRKADSMLANFSTILVVLEKVSEGNPVNSPMTSMVMVLAYGHAIAAALISARNFDNSKYKIYHPGGKLGASMVKVSELMKTGDDIPLVKENGSMQDVIGEITEKNLGCTGIIDTNNKLIGIITDGDLRRIIQKYHNIMDLKIDEVMTKNPKKISENSLAVEAVSLMSLGREDTKNKGISTLFVNKEGKENEITGIIHLNHCIKAGIC